MIRVKVGNFVIFAVVMMLVVQVSGYNTEPDATDEEVPILTRSLAFNSDLSEYEFLSLGEYDYVTSAGMRHFTGPGEPFLPMKTIVMEFDKNVDILEVSISYERRVPIEGAYDIAPTPKPLTWSGYEISELEKDLEVYALDSYFPGEVFSYRVGEDNHKKFVYVHIYPVQYVPSSGRISIVTDLVLDIRYQGLPTEEPLADPMTAQCIIITPPALYPEARRLSDFHENSLGVPTAVVNTTWIGANYPEAEDPPFNGYWNASIPGRETIVGYNYSLAKMIVSYLRNQSAHPNLNHVLLYGNAELTPPSFYWYDNVTGPFMPYEGWIPTDFFYSSPDYDLTPNYAVGRLPVDRNLRAQLLNQKIESWYGNLSADWFEEAAVAGGKPFFTPFYVGELITVDALDRGYFDGFNITKKYITDGQFDRTNVLEVLSGGYGIFYELGHGHGDAWVVNETMFPGELINVSDVMGLSPNSKVPVIVSIACDNGAYDNTLMTLKPFPSNISFGESLLFSPAGGIAYVGGSRMNAGMPLGTLDEGEVNITEETYMAYMLTSFWRTFYEGTDTLGNISMAATAYFTADQDMNDHDNKRALFEYVLLGDPVLPMSHPRTDMYRVPATQVSNVGWYEYFGFPMLVEGEIPVIPTGLPNPIIVGTDSPNVDFKIIDVISDTVVATGSNPTTNNETQYVFTPPIDSTYLFRASGEDGKEGWQYMRSTLISNPPLPPALTFAELNGLNNENVLIGWNSTDEGDPSGAVLYRVLRATAIGGPYSVIAEIPATGQPGYVYVDFGRGAGDLSNYFYYICSVNVLNLTACTFGKGGKFTRALAEGPNLVSIPLLQSDETIESVLRTVEFDNAWYYDSVDGRWKWFMGFKPYEGDLQSMDRTLGIWVNVTSASNLTVAGLLPFQTMIQLRAGWNLVGFPSFDPLYTIPELNAAVGATRVEGFNPAPPYCLRVLGPAEVLEAGYGYWIRVNSDALWTVPIQ